MGCGTANILLLMREDVKIATGHWKEGITEETDPINRETWLFQSASHSNILSCSTKDLIFIHRVFPSSTFNQKRLAQFANFNVSYNSWLRITVNFYISEHNLTFLASVRVHKWGKTFANWGRVWVRREEKRNKYVEAALCQHQGETPQEFCLYQTHYGADLYSFANRSVAAAGSVWFNTKAHNICCFKFYFGIFILTKSGAVIPQHCIKRKQLKSSWNARSTKPHPLGENDWKKL